MAKEFKPGSTTGKQRKGRIAISVSNENIVKCGTDLFDLGKINDNKIANISAERTMLSVKNNGSTNTFTVVDKSIDETTSVVGLVVLPTLGGRKGAFRTQLAFKDQFIKAVGDAYYSSNISEADLIKLFMYNESLGGLIMQIDLALALTSNISSINAATAMHLIKLMKFDYDDLVNARQQWIDLRNRLANLLNTKFYVAHNQAIDEFYYLLSHVFIDEVSQKGQPILVKPLLYTNIDQTDGTLYIDTRLCTNDTFDKQPAIYRYNITNIVEEAEFFSMSAWYNQVAPILMHLYGDSKEGLYQFGDHSDVPLAFTFSYNLLMAIRNAKLTKALVDPSADVISSCTIYENTDGYIKQGGSISIVPKGMMCQEILHYTTYGADANLHCFKNSIMCLDEWPASSDSKNAGLQFYFIEDEVTNGKTPIAGYESRNYIEYCGHLLLLDVTYCTIYSDTTVPYKFTNDVDYLVLGISTPGTIRTQSVSGNYNSILDAMIRSQGLNTSRNKLILNNTASSGPDLTIDTISEYYHDKDNVIYLSDDYLEDYYVQRTYDMMMFTVPAFQGRK